MNEALEFHDSDVQSVEAEGGCLTLRFSAAYIHRSAGQPGVDAGEGYLQAAQVLFRNADFVGNLSECVGTLYDGSIVVSGQPLGLVPVPFISPGPVRAEFLFNNGSSLRIEAASVSCSCYDRSEFVERFSA